MEVPRANADQTRLHCDVKFGNMEIHSSAVRSAQSFGQRRDLLAVHVSYGQRIDTSAFDNDDLAC